MSDHPETCEKCGYAWGWCQCPVKLIQQDDYDALTAEVATLRARLASVERERDEIIAMAERREDELRARLEEAERDAARLNQEWERECADSDAVLRALKLDPTDYRTDGGSLNLGKIRGYLSAQKRAIELMRMGEETLLGEANEALAACQSEGSAWKHRAEMLDLLLSDTGQRRVYWAALAVANAIHAGIGSMIHGTDMERDLRDALWLRDGELRDVPKGAASQPSAARTCPVCHQSIDDDEVLGSCMHGGPGHRRVVRATDNGSASRG